MARAVGVTAAQLAAAGISGRRDILESPLATSARVSDFAGPENFSVFEICRARAGARLALRGASTSPSAIDRRLPAHHGAPVVSLVPKRHRSGVIDGSCVRIPLVAWRQRTMFSRRGSDGAARPYRSAVADWTYITLLFDGYYPVAAAAVRRRPQLA